MLFVEIFIIAVVLSLDAFAVSICKGVQLSKRDTLSACIVGSYFGIFQALMPLLGYYLGSSLESAISTYSMYISFIILFGLGANMLYQTHFKHDACDSYDAKPLGFMVMILAAIATSIDAFAVGVVFKYNYNIMIFLPVLIIGCTTFTISVIGVRLGYLFNDSFKKKAETIGGLTLILLGFKFLMT